MVNPSKLAYLSEMELKHLQGKDTGARGKGSMDNHVNNKVSDLGDHLESLATEIAFMKSQGFINDDIWSELSEATPRHDTYTPPNVYHHTKDDFDKHIQFGYFFGYLAHLLNKSVDSDQQNPSVAIGFLCGLFETYGPVDEFEIESTEHQDLIEDYKTTIHEMQVSSEETIELTTLISRSESKLESFAETTTFDKDLYSQIIRYVSSRTIATTQSFVEALHQSLPQSTEEELSEQLSEITYVLKKTTELKPADRLAELIIEDVDKIESKSWRALDVKPVFETVASAKDRLSTDTIRDEIPHSTRGRNHQNVGRIINQLSEKKGWFDRRLITEDHNEYELSAYGKLVWKCMSSAHNPAEITHAYALQQWEHVSPDQDVYEPLVDTVLCKVEIPIRRQIDVIDLDD